MRAGLTLVELLVVLTILAVLAGTAVMSTDGLVDQTRYEATRTTLTSVEDAILGRPGLVGPQDQPWITGFVADIGRVPHGVGSGPTTLSELWEQPLGLPAFGIGVPAGDSDVRVPVGWRGPYVRLPLGTAGLLDGWGQPLVVAQADGNAVVVGTAVAAVSTLGADHEPGGTDYDEDLGIVLEAVGPPAVAARHVGDVPVRITGAEGAAFVVARLYGPVVDLTGTLVAGTLLQVVLQPAEPAEVSDPTNLTLMLENVPIGPRVLRVYLCDNDPEEEGETPQDPLPLSGTQRGPIIPLVVVPGGLPEVVIAF